MRYYKNLKYDNDKEIINFMQALSKPNISVEEYRCSFYSIGKALGTLLNERVKDDGSIMIACTSEDTDWLAKGIMDTFSRKDFSLAVFWNERITTNKELKQEFSPIIKSYVEPIKNCHTLIIVKSIISTSCVVRTQITRLYGDINPSQIYIVAPVMFKGADKSLSYEFPEEISSKFEYLTFAIDTERNEAGCIIPGVGGMVYPKLGLGDPHTKNKYIPELVKLRFSENK